jgi:hypothetical protein
VDHSWALEMKPRPDIPVLAILFWVYKTEWDIKLPMPQLAKVMSPLCLFRPVFVAVRVSFVIVRNKTVQEVTVYLFKIGNDG